jgi:hypothetical protein
MDAVRAALRWMRTSMDAECGRGSTIRTSMAFALTSFRCDRAFETSEIECIRRISMSMDGIGAAVRCDETSMDSPMHRNERELDCGRSDSFAEPVIYAAERSAPSIRPDISPACRLLSTGVARRASSGPGDVSAASNPAIDAETSSVFALAALSSPRVRTVFTSCKSFFDHFEPPDLQRFSHQFLAPDPLVNSTVLIDLADRLAAAQTVITPRRELSDSR